MSMLLSAVYSGKSKVKASANLVSAVGLAPYTQHLLALFSHDLIACPWASSIRPQTCSWGLFSPASRLPRIHLLTLALGILSVYIYLVGTQACWSCCRCLQSSSFLTADCLFLLNCSFCGGLLYSLETWFLRWQTGAWGLAILFPCGCIISWAGVPFTAWAYWQSECHKGMKLLTRLLIIPLIHCEQTQRPL